MQALGPALRTLRVALRARRSGGAPAVRLQGRPSPAWVLPGIFSLAEVRCVLCALSRLATPGGRCCLAPVCVPPLCPAACLSGLPRGSVLVRRALPGPVALSAPLGCPVTVVSFPNRGFRPRTYWAAARGKRRLAENLDPGACRSPPPRRGRWARSASYSFGAHTWGVPGSPSGVGLGLRAPRWFDVWGPGHSGVQLPMQSNGVLSRCTGAVLCGRQHLPFRVGGRCIRSGARVGLRALLGWVGRAGLPGALWRASLFLWLFSVLSLSARRRQGRGCPVCVSLCFPLPPFLPLVLRSLCSRLFVVSGARCPGARRPVVGTPPFCGVPLPSCVCLPPLGVGFLRFLALRALASARLMCSPSLSPSGFFSFFLFFPAPPLPPCPRVHYLLSRVGLSGGAHCPSVVQWSGWPARVCRVPCCAA